MRQTGTAQRGFTLIELSMVLVIIGLLVGGVLVGRDLIRQSQLRTVITDFTMFDTAVSTFQTKYGSGAIPGDWGKAPTILGQANCWGGVALVNGTCADFYATDTSSVPDDGRLTYNDAGGDPVAEPALFWQQLSLQRLVPGSYAGLTASALGIGGHYDAIGGVNAPVSKIPGVIINIVYMDATVSLWPISNPKEGNYYLFGSSINNTRAVNAAVTGTETGAVDKKFDDGLPLSGAMLAQPNVCCTGANWSCVDFNNSVYQSGSNSQCAFMILSGNAN